MRTSQVPRHLHFSLLLFLFSPLILASIFRKGFPIPASVTKDVPSETGEADQSARDLFPHRVLSSIIAHQLDEEIEFGKIYVFSRFYPGSILKELFLGYGYVDLLYASWVFDKSTNGKYLYARSYRLVFKDKNRAKNSQIEMTDFLPKAALTAVKDKHTFIAHGKAQAEQVLDRSTMATLLDEVFVDYRRQHMEKKMGPRWCRGLEKAFPAAAKVQYPKGKNEEKNQAEEVVEEVKEEDEEDG